MYIVAGAKSQFNITLKEKWVKEESYVVDIPLSSANGDIASNLHRMIHLLLPLLLHMLTHLNCLPLLHPLNNNRSHKCYRNCLLLHLLLLHLLLLLLLRFLPHNLNPPHQHLHLVPFLFSRRFVVVGYLSSVVIG